MLNLEPSLLKKLYRNYLALREAELLMVDIYYKGKVPGHIHSGEGEEATLAAVLELMRPGDYFSGHHRVLASTYLTGVSFREIFAEIMGKRTGTARGVSGCNHTCDLRKGGLGTSSSLGSDTGIAVGAAYTCKLRGDGSLAIKEYGDATSSRGPVHEGMVLAASWKLPVLFVSTYNTFGISGDSRELLPTRHPTADRAQGYGMPSEVADGSDILDVYEKAAKLMAYIRETGMPAVLETQQFRWRGHFEGDLCAYRSEDEARAAREKDGLARLEKHLLDTKVMTAEEVEALKKEVADELADAVRFAEESPAPTMDDVYTMMLAEEN
ncbi:MAG TPA: thiamine pyrophosphate-dependent dehydrogenase E1 component subunit alpha [Candidatus Limnocylindria bacterium]|nr:thiamine pyrophosphate-dependent dehydrogenase E1 component subunit alpha [Candidatus Limnocylindria bacterium]